MTSFLKKFISILTISVLCLGFSACRKTLETCTSGHSWKLTSTTANCFDAGIESYECEVCKETKTETVSAYGHDLIQSSYTAPTCKTNGEEVSKCSRCGFESKQTLLVIDHNYQVKSTTPSTCTVKGSQTLECSMCHETKTEQLQLKDHDYELKNTVNSTCIVHGYEYYQCKDCTASRSEELEFADHTYETKTKEATCFTHGGTIEKCSVCGDEKPVNETPLFTHEFGADGYCAKCRVYKTLFDVDKLNVSWGGSPIGTIRGSLPTKFNDGDVPDSYWKEHIVTLKITLFDIKGEELEAHSFNSTTIPFEGANQGKLTIQYLRSNGEIGDFKANEFVIALAEGNKYSIESRQNCKSFKIELSCEGYETIEKIYTI